jgi:hypothetical protein
VNPIAPDFGNEWTALADHRCSNSLAPLQKRFRSLDRREFADEYEELRTALHQRAEREWRISDAGIPGHRQREEPMGTVDLNLDQ